MSNAFRLYLRVMDGHLQIVPWGNLTDSGVDQILGAAQAGLRVFPVIVVDLHDARDLPEDALARLEAGLRQLVAARGLVLGLEPQKWTLQTAPPHSCQCQGDCRNCPCKSHADPESRKQAENA